MGFCPTFFLHRPPSFTNVPYYTISLLPVLDPPALCRFVLAGGLGDEDLRGRLRRVRNNGIRGVDLRYTLTQVLRMTLYIAPGVEQADKLIAAASAKNTLPKCFASAGQICRWHQTRLGGKSPTVCHRVGRNRCFHDFSAVTRF